MPISIIPCGKTSSKYVIDEKEDSKRPKTIPLIIKNIYIIDSPNTYDNNNQILAIEFFKRI